MVDMKDWIHSGDGATAKSYFNRYDDSIMLKLFDGNITTDDYVAKEFELSKTIEASGVSTPVAIEMTESDDGRKGIIYQRIIGKNSFSRLCADNPEKLEYYAKLFAVETKKLHAIKYDESRFNNLEPRIAGIKRGLNNHKGYSAKTVSKLNKLLESLEDTKTLLHGDLQSGNLIYADGKTYWIDLGAFSYGNPMFDIGCMYFFYVFGPGKIFARKSVHLNSSQLDRFWKAFSAEYIGSTDQAEIARFTADAKKAFLLYLVYTIEFENYEGIVARIFDIAINIMTSMFL